MHCYTFSKTGQRHLTLGQPGQDQLFGILGSRHSAVCLSDGGSFTAYGCEAAQQTAAITARLFYDHFWELLLADSATVRRTVCATLLPALQEYATQKNIPPESLAATMLVLAADDQGRFISAHLGDGRILMQEPDLAPKQFSVISSPSCGVVPHSTYLTMNASLMRHLKVARVLRPAPRKFLLLTDGADEFLRSTQEPKTLPCRFSGQEIEHCLDALRPEDDYSAVELSTG